MENAHFDCIARTLAASGETRRAVLRLLAGSALGSVATRLRLDVDAEASPRAKHQGPRRKERRRSEPMRSEGKGKKKSGKKKRKPQAPPTLCPHDCADDGGKCCPDGSCVSQALCCPGERMCAGGACQPERQCCRDEYQCADGSCVDRTLCCPDEKRCGSGACIPADQCCSDAPPPHCTECEKEACENGSLVCRSNLECPPEWRANTEECRCEQCEEICDPQTNGGLCQWPGCQYGERCIDGLCNSICTNPDLPQLCCAQNEWTGRISCYCTSAETICFNCGGSVCGCIPGTEYCCNQSDNNPNCPAECACL